MLAGNMLRFHTAGVNHPRSMRSQAVMLAGRVPNGRPSQHPWAMGS